MAHPAVLAFGRNLRAVREAAEVTQEQLALLSGIDMSNLSRYESGRQEPGVRVIVRLAQALEVEPGRFFEGLPAES